MSAHNVSAAFGMNQSSNHSVETISLLDEDELERMYAGSNSAIRISSLLVFVAVTSYMTSAQVRYEQNTRGKKRAKTASASGCLSRHSSGSTVTLSVRMRICSLSCSVMATLMLLLKLTFEVLHLVSDGLHLCEFLLNAIFAMQTWTLTLIYLLLWFRQRLFYAASSTHHLTTPFARLLSQMSLLAIFIIGLLVPVLFGLARHFSVSHEGCHFVADTNIAYVYLIVTVTLSIYFHMSLLYLFITPVLKHRSNVKPNGRGRSNVGPNEDLISVVRRACYVTILCVITDVIMIVSISLLSKNEKVQSCIEDVIVISNVVGSNLTFVNWKKRLFPWKCSVVPTRGDTKLKILTVGTRLE